MKRVIIVNCMIGITINCKFHKFMKINSNNQGEELQNTPKTSRKDPREFSVSIIGTKESFDALVILSK